MAEIGFCTGSYKKHKTEDEINGTSVIMESDHKYDKPLNCRCKCCGNAFYYDAYSDQSFAYKGEWKMNGGV